MKKILKWIKRNEKNIKTISKYATNFIGMALMLLTGLNAIEGINIPIQIYQVLGVIQGVIGAYLVGGKLFDLEEKDYLKEDE